MAENTKKYQIILELPNQEDYPFTDIIHFSIVRVPLVKQASFAVICLNLPLVAYIRMKNSISSNEFPMVGIRIYSVDTGTRKKVTELLYRSYRVLGANSLNPIRMDSQMNKVELLLVDPILHELGVRSTYNPILENIKAIDIIKNYEDYIDKYYGKYFENKQIISKPNPMIYEQILVKPFIEERMISQSEKLQISALTDLDVPNFIINKYKPTHTLSFYFFDDFAAKNDSLITRNFISLYDSTLFEQVDITKHPDVYGQTGIISIEEIADGNKIMDKTNEVVTFRTIDGIYSTQKKTSGDLTAGKTISKNKIEITDKREATLRKQSYEIRNKPGATDFMNIFTSDTSDIAQERIKIIKESLKDRLDHIATFETHKCSFDWLNFGKIYNMDPDASGSFLYTPIAIWNVFRRSEPKEDLVEHHCRYNMLKFIK